jgi:hypothetical protein
MAKAYKKFVVVALAMLIALGSVSNAVAAALTCLPKACCCTVKTPNMVGHLGQMEMEMPQRCTPKTPAPCCRVEPFQPKTDMMISWLPSDVPQRMSLAHMIADDTLKLVQQDSLNAFKSVMDTGPLLKIPLVPIYLQTLSFLC